MRITQNIKIFIELCNPNISVVHVLKLQTHSVFLSLFVRSLACCSFLATCSFDLFKFELIDRAKCLKLHIKIVQIQIETKSGVEGGVNKRCFDDFVEHNRNKSYARSKLFVA